MNEIISAANEIRDRLNSHKKSATPRGGAAQSVTLGIPESMLTQVTSAINAWRESPEGQSALKSASQGQLDALRQAVNQLFQSELFVNFFQKLRSNRSLSEISLPIKSIALGFVGQIDLGVGIYGSLGYAADIDDVSGSSVVYIYGAFTEGLEAGLDAGAQLSLWRNSVSDMPGYYWGCELDVTDVGGFAVAGLAKEKDDDVVQAVLVDLTGGENDGVDGLEFYAVTINITHYPVAQQQAQHLLILTNLQCLNTMESGHDEVYFLFTPDGGTTYRYPTWNYYAMSASSKDPESNWAVGRSVWFNNSVKITLYDDSDVLGSFTFNLQGCSSSDDSCQNLPNVGSTATATSDIKDGINEIEYKMSAQRVL